MSNNKAGQDINEHQQKIVDAKLPLPWLIGSACAVVFSMGGVFVKLDNLGQSLTKLEAKTDTRDERLLTLSQTLMHQAGKNDVQDAQITSVHNEIRSLQRDIEDLKMTQRYMPKQ